MDYGFETRAIPAGRDRRLADTGVRAEWMRPLDGSEDWSKPLPRVAAASGKRLWVSSLDPAAVAARCWSVPRGTGLSR